MAVKLMGQQTIILRPYDAKAWHLFMSTLLRVGLFIQPQMKAIFTERCILLSLEVAQAVLMTVAAAVLVAYLLVL
jgi:hypothetical protein